MIEFKTNKEAIQHLSDITNKRIKIAKPISDKCPSCLQDNEVNVKNHLMVIKEYNLGPENPRETNMEFWEDKAQKWGVAEGDARGRLCSNCEHFLSTSQIQECIDNGPSLTLKASDLPLEPKWADVESKPSAVCMLYDITCSPTRVCDSQEMGGPIDDTKAKAMDLAKMIYEKLDPEEYNNPFA